MNVKIKFANFQSIISNCQSFNDIHKVLKILWVGFIAEWPSEC